MVVFLILVFPESYLETLIPLPNSEKPNPAGPTNSAGRCLGRHSPSFFHYGMQRLCQVTTSEWKVSAG